jgi:predicted DsbA family dithiol-disulfide isomerase
VVATRVHLIAWSDYLCPWCYNAAVRLGRLEDDFGERVLLEWRTFLLRPYPDPERTLEQFRAYTGSWLRPAAEPDAGSFRVWQSDEGPPSHSVPPHLVAKAAAALGAEAFRAMHARLLHAYFAENRDITAAETLLALWREVGLPEASFAAAAREEALREVVEQHNDAVRREVTGVPAVMMVGNDTPIVGAMPYETYRRWVERGLRGED